MQQNYNIITFNPVENPNLRHWVQSARIQESMNQLFEIDMEVWLDPEFDMRKLVGDHATITLFNDKNSKAKEFHGRIHEIYVTGKRSVKLFDEETESFKNLCVIKIASPLWLLSQDKKYRFFQNMAITDIITDVLDKANIKDYEMDITAPTSKKHNNPRFYEYCVQYGESSLQFITRLLEKDGGYFFFDHKPGEKSKLIITDKPNHFEKLEGFETIKYQQQAYFDQDPHIKEFDISKMDKLTDMHVSDYNFLAPKNHLKLEINEDTEQGRAPHHHHDHHTGMLDKKAAEFYQKIRIDAHEAMKDVFLGETNVFLSPGHLFTMDGFNQELDKEYLVLQTLYTINNNFIFNGIKDNTSSEEPEDSFAVRFHAINNQKTYRPTASANKPTVRGVQTAFVTGPQDGSMQEGEIYTDALGRVRVKFPWDLEQNVACWVRVAQIWAGKKYGFNAVPRIGQEVIVDFVDGDPDRPVITGCLHNADHWPAFDLPNSSDLENAQTTGSERTKIGFKTRSEGMGPDAFNEFSFDDKQGSETIYMHAQKDYNQEVQNNLNRTINHDVNCVINNQEQRKIIKDQFIEIDGNQHTNIKQDYLIKANNHHMTLDGMMIVDVMTNMALRPKQMFAVTSTNIGLQATGEILLQAPNIMVESPASITLKVGASFLHISPAGIALSGPMLRLNSGGSPAKSMVQPQMPTIAQTPALLPEKTDIKKQDGDA